MSTSERCDLDAVLVALAAMDGVAILATDTLPGLHARLDRPRALARLTALKGRDAGKPLLALAADLAMARTLIRPLPGAVYRYLAVLWPGPFTAILPAAEGLPPAVVADAGTVAVRIPDRDDLRALLADAGPLASTSANRAGDDPATDLAAASAAFPELPVWTAPTPPQGGQASALIDLTGPAPRLVRSGPRDLPPWAGSSG